MRDVLRACGQKLGFDGQLVAALDGPQTPENLLRLFFTLRVILILQGYFYRPSENTFLKQAYN